MYSSYSAAAFALRSGKSFLQAHSSYSYLPSHHCYRHDPNERHRHHELITQSPYLSARLLLNGCLLRHSAHLLLLSARLRPSVPPHQHTHPCCRWQASAHCFCCVSGGRPVDGQSSWQAEARGCRCCPHGTGMPDLGAVCRRLKAPECLCNSSGGVRSVGADYGRRDAPRLVGRAVWQDVWEYEGGQWPRRRCSTECHDDWEDEEECGYFRLEVAGGMQFGRWEDDDVNDSDGHCRYCYRRKGLGSYYSGEDVYSSRCRKRRDVGEDSCRFREFDRRGWQQREYYDDQDDLDLRRQRQRWERRGSRDLEFDDAIETRRVEPRRYWDGCREYDCRRERREFDSDDMADVRRAGQYADDVWRSDRRRESRDFEIDDTFDASREGRRRSNDDPKYVSWNDKEIYSNEQDLAEQRYYPGVSSKKSAVASSLHEDGSKRDSRSRSTVATRHTRQEENSSSRVRWRGNVDRQTEQISEERDRQRSVGWSNDERDTYDYDDARFVSVRDSRIGTREVKVITEDDTGLASSSKNTSISKPSRNTNQQAAMHKDESRKIMEISEVQDNSTERDSRAQSYHQEDRQNYTEIRSPSVQDSMKMANESRRQVDLHNEVNQNLVSLTDSRKNSENLTNLRIDNSHNASTASRLLRNHNKVNQMDIDDRSTSLQNITNVTRDKKRIVNRQVIHETDIDVQNISHVDVSKIHSTDTSASRSSQSHLETRPDVNSTSSISFINSTRSQENEVYQNRISASESPMARGSHSYLETGRHDEFHSTSSSTTVAENTRESQEQVELNIAGASSAVVASNVKSSQDSRYRMVRSEDAHHNMDLVWQHAETSGISDDEDITGLLVESTEEGSSMVNVEMAQQAAIMGSNDQEVRSETTTGSSIPSGSSARQSVKESMLESAVRLAKSSTFHVGQFVDELQKGVSDADIASTKKNEKSIASSSGFSMKGPADETWDVQSTTSQETFKTADKEEGYLVDGATNSASQTSKNESTLARKVHKSLWAYVADIIRLGWIHRGDSPNSSHKSVKKTSSINSQSTEGWVSSQEHDNDGTRKKNGSTNTKNQQLINSHSGELESGVAPMSKEERLPTATQCFQKPETVIEPQVGTCNDLLARSSTDNLHISGEGIKQSNTGESPKGNNIDDSTPTMEDVTVGHLRGHRTSTSSRITTKDSGEFNTRKAMLTDCSSVTISATEAGRNGDGADWLHDPSGAITPYHHPQRQAVMPHENTSTGTLELPELLLGGSVTFEEKNVVQEAPGTGVTKTVGKDAELKKRMFQRNKQVLKETFDEWEEAYQHAAEQGKTDELFMREALLESQRAADIWEVPVGAVLVQNGEIIARGYNLVEDLRDSTAHAEIVCIREASNKLKTWRLADTTLYVTLEPCAMCAGAILQARIDTVVWGAPNRLLGADGSWVRLFPGDGQTSTLESASHGQTVGPVHPFHPKIAIRRGVLSAECSEIMQQFFQLRRRKKQKPQSPPRAHHHGHHHPLKFFSKVHHMFGTIFCL